MKEKGLTQQNLSDMLIDAGAYAGLNTIKSWFRKNPKNRHASKLETIQIMAKIFGVTIDSLVNNTHFNENIFVPTRVKTKNIANLIHINDDFDTTLNSTNTIDNPIKTNNKTNINNSLLQILKEEIHQNPIQNTATLSQMVFSQRLQTKTAHKFLELFSEFGNDKLLLSIINKLEKIKQISEN